MSDVVELWEKPEAETIYMIAGWRQWADAGSMSSGLPKYLIQETGAKKIGRMNSDGFYLFQIPGTHDLVRPVVKFNEGYPEELETRRNDLYYAEVNGHGLVYFLGDEPHLDVERYVSAFLEAAKTLKVKRIIGFGGVYAEVPFDKERPVSCSYSLPQLKDEVAELAVDLTEYNGGASIGSVICKRAGEQNMDYIGLYAFAPTYDFSHLSQLANGFRIENDFKAWLGVMKRVNYLLKINFNLSELETKTRDLDKTIKEKIDDLEVHSPEIGLRDYMDQLSESFDETVFDPLSDVWADELRRLLDDSESPDG